MVQAVQRFGVALVWSIGLAIAGIIYAQVFSAEIYPLVDKDGLFSTPVVWLNNLVPLVIVILLLAVWVWAIAGAVEEEKTRRRRRV